MDFSDLSDFIEPFKIHIVENIQINTRNDRLTALEKTGYNVFKIHPEDVIIDFLTDAGTNGLSLKQNSRLWMGDESYAGSSSFEILKDNTTYISGFENILPVFSKRTSEEIVASYLAKAGDKVIGNTFTYTLENHLKHIKAEPISMVDWSDENFGGNLDTKAFRNFLKQNDKEEISFVIMNVPSKNLGGQPVSMSNMKEVSDLCREHSIPIYIESSMYGENCWRTKMHEENYFNKSLVEISLEMFSYFDGCILSAKRDGRSEIGSVICLRDEEMIRELGSVITFKAGFITYGGMAGRDMEIVAEGMRSALDEQLQDYREKQLAYFKKSLKEFGVPIVEPIGCNTIFIDAEKAFPQLSRKFYPAWSLACAAYIIGGIRCAEFGQITHATQSLPDDHPLKGRELIKLEVPRFIYTTCHFIYVAYVFSQLISHKMISGMEIVDSPECKVKHIKTSMVPLSSMDYGDIHLLPVLQNCDHLHFFKHI
ncbi:tryptophanase 1 isoform X1 [Octopus bimaculoides]|uniref:Aromatic amino acid beta-eliminating lyase/threonine aldolase domain-containing protein n=1 Tax=Octopus bimaculoides TaxID=37653 RepID=A0A0L8I3Y4_OCTBM|nr:tryptophanase 1 isoform X1 [Octopus bimaculoides]|eukprot:XP_014791032.1 PREDICTED: tryptophanase 1-like isoform X1 [Octopus bimaculoides]